MNYIQTLYIDSSKNPLKNSFGWARPEYHLMSWALSCLQLKKIYGNVELYANNTAAELLINDLKLPYSLVNTSLDNYKLIDHNLWALPKLYTYSLQTEPFLHIDGDVFLFNKLPDVLLQSALIAQNPEVATEYYTSTQKLLMEHFTYLPTSVKSDFNSGIPINAVNAGIFGGHDVDFFKHYTAEAFEYIDRNKQHFKDIDVDKFNVFFEQHLFYSMAKEQKKNVKFLFEDIFEDRGYLYLANFHEVPYNRTYLHLLGHFKRNEFICRQLASVLQNLYPEYYFRIMSLYKNNKLPFYTNFFNDFEVKNFSNYKNLILSTYDSFKYCSNDSAPSERLSIERAILIKLFDLNFNFCEVDELSDFTTDFKIFSERIVSTYNEYSYLSKSYLYGRDLLSINWCEKIFENELNIEKVTLQKTIGIQIIESVYNWAGYFNKLYNVGIPYYEKMEVLKGEYFNLIIPDLTDIGFFMIDIEDIDKTILEILHETKTIKEIFNIIESYVEDDVINNHYVEFRNLVIESIRRLIINKAIQPI